jgi:hypothetical protein
MILFLALCCVGVAIAGFTAFMIFWPLTLVHVRDRHPAVTAELGTGAFLKPIALGWLLTGRYRNTRDSSLTGLATPARISLLTIAFGLVMAAALWSLSELLG